MKNQFNKIYIVFIAVLFIAISFCVNQTEAHRGCCSWHGGVCGCKCCDGTFLSSTCAPYYPSCSSSTPKIDYTNSTSAYATVTRVVDGDTIEVKLFTGNIEKVRLIGIDTPETVDPRKPIECFGKEATAKMKKLVNGKIIKLVRKTEENRGKYGRLLRYVYVVGDGTFVNAEMIKQGYAYAYTKYPFDTDLMKKFKQYEQEAKKNKQGLWADGACENSNEKIPTFAACTFWFYSNWSECIDKEQTRTIIYSSPFNCIGGNPVLSQSCQVETDNEPEINESNPDSSIPEGAIIKTVNNPDVYIVKYVGAKKFKRLILNPSVFNNYGHLKWENITDVSQVILDSFTTSELVRAVGDNKIYRLYPQGDFGQKRMIKNNSVLTRLGFDSDSIYEINNFDRESYLVGNDLK